MSKTDKDRPYWVVNYQDGGGHIDHDHRTGECIEETLELAQYFAGNSGWRWGRDHRKRCAKRTEVHYECTKDDANTKWGRPWGSLTYRTIRTCWTRMCVCPIPDAWKYEHHGCDQSVRRQCIGHTRIEWDDSISCVCDNFPERPTCDFAVPDNVRGGWNRRRYTWGGVPSDFVRRYYHKPERARERDLDDMRREYNAYGDIEDDDFVNRQARNSCRWLYW